MRQTQNLPEHLQASPLIPGQIPIITDRHTSWQVRLYVDEPYDPLLYTRPNRRDYYKIILVKKGAATLLAGSVQYTINTPSMVCLHPHDIISWKSPDDNFLANAIYIKQEALRNASIRTMIGQCRLFDTTASKVSKLSGDNDLTVMSEYFLKMQSVVHHNDFVMEVVSAYLQLLLVEIRQRCFAAVDGMFVSFPSYVKQFFELLENETAQLSTAMPLKLKTAREYATQLSVHPNYLNAVLKKHTGQNVSTHIRSRLVEEAKSLLVQTDWTIKEISYLIGFSDPPNFTVFFKSNTGYTPADFRNRSLIV